MIEPQAVHGIMEASFENRKPRAVSILLVLILHALLIFALLTFMVRPQSSPFHMAPETRLLEMFINTARPPKPEAKKEAPASTPGPIPQTVVPGEPFTPTVPIPAPDIRGFGQALVGCAPENLSNLDETQRAHCRKFGASGGYDPGAVDYADRIGKVPGAKLWARELARKQAPLLLPCANASKVDYVYTGACIVANIANGFTFQKQYENQQSYFDTPGK
ncbi:MAG: hypothetical protein H0U98_13845 [Alphaproteobacteria bacterium]|nr:hypothetical protein [Alphaproteobacteria bacterium]